MVMVVCMVFIGGVTRLTESGLSIVEWKMVSGILPPMSDSAWEAEFAEYKTSPEFIKKNTHFGVEEFKNIYWLEWLHRLLGRITGLVFLLPLIIFAVQKKLPKPLFWRMFAISALVGTQGTVGWIMVASGLEDAPRVNPIKLALHLSIAFTIFCALLWTFLQLTRLRPSRSHAGVRTGVRVLLGITVVQIILGALVAGLDAGYSYNTYPLMDGEFIPSQLYLLSPWWKNHLESILTVQFQHRMGALILVISTLALVAYAWRHWFPEERPWLKALLLILGIQFLLGVSTLLTHMNIWVASAHQLVALALLAVLTLLMYRTPKRKIPTNMAVAATEA